MPPMHFPFVMNIVQKRQKRNFRYVFAQCLLFYELEIGYLIVLYYPMF